MFAAPFHPPVQAQRVPERAESGKSGVFRAGIGGNRPGTGLGGGILRKIEKQRPVSVTTQWRDLPVNAPAHWNPAKKKMQPRTSRQTAPGQPGRPSPEAFTAIARGADREQSKRRPVRKRCGCNPGRTRLQDRKQIMWLLTQEALSAAAPGPTRKKAAEPSSPAAPKSGTQRADRFSRSPASPDTRPGS